MTIPAYLIGDPNSVYPRMEDLVKVEISTLETWRKNPEPPIEWLNTMPLWYLQNPVWLIDNFPSYDVQGFEWWVADVQEQELAEFEKFGDEIRVPNPETKTVTVSREILPWTAEEIEDEMLRRIEVFKDQIYSFVKNRLNVFVATRRYENLNDAISHQNSTYPSIKAEADRAVDLRDTYRMVMFNIMKDVEARIIPIPDESEIADLNWPVLLWEVGPPIEPEVPVEVIDPIDPPVEEGNP